MLLGVVLLFAGYGFFPNTWRMGIGWDEHPHEFIDWICMVRYDLVLLVMFNWDY